MSLPAMDRNKNAWRELFFVAALKGQTNSIRQSRRIVCAALFIVFTLNGQMVKSDETSCLDENQVHQAMREEAFRLLVQKIAAVQNRSVSGFDYHIEQAYAIIKKRLPPDPLPAAELVTFLRQFFQNPNTTNNDREFQILIDHFVLGTSLEIINTLQHECDHAVDLIAQVGKLEDEIKKTPHPDLETLDRALRQSSLSKKMYKIIKYIDRRWKIPLAGSDNFSVFNIWRKNMIGQGLDRDQRLVFDLGDRYSSKYPFLGEFMEKYRRLAETFHQAVHNLNAMLDNSSESDFKAFE